MRVLPKHGITTEHRTNAAAATATAFYESSRATKAWDHHREGRTNTAAAKATAFCESSRDAPSGTPPPLPSTSDKYTPAASSSPFCPAPAPPVSSPSPPPPPSSSCLRGVACAPVSRCRSTTTTRFPVQNALRDNRSDATPVLLSRCTRGEAARTRCGIGCGLGCGASVGARTSARNRLWWCGISQGHSASTANIAVCATP